jgi:hypothetical protein
MGGLICGDAEKRMDAGGALKKLKKMIFSMTPEALLMAPERVERGER